MKRARFTEDDLRVLYRGAQVIVRTIDAVEARCMAADGPVTPTTAEITGEEDGALERAADRIASRRKMTEPTRGPHARWRDDVRRGSVGRRRR